MSTPVIRLRRLSDNELLALAMRLSRLFMQKEGTAVPIVTDGEIERFIRTATAKAGAEELITPREIIRDFLTLLNILKDNPEATFDELIKGESLFEKADDKAFAKAEPQTKSRISLFDIDI